MESELLLNLDKNVRTYRLENHNQPLCFQTIQILPIFPMGKKVFCKWLASYCNVT